MNEPIKEARGMLPPELNDATWRKSSRSPSQSECVELTSLPGRLAIRDSKNPDTTALIITQSQGRTLLQRLKHQHADDSASTTAVG
jgi:Domain of unknown function (DUF397)